MYTSEKNYVSKIPEIWKSMDTEQGGCALGIEIFRDLVHLREIQGLYTRV